MFCQVTVTTLVIALTIKADEGHEDQLACIRLTEKGMLFDDDGVWRAKPRVLSTDELAALKALDNAEAKD